VVVLQAEDREAELKRLQQERVELRERMSESRARNREMTSVMNDLQLCLNDLQSKVRGRRQRKSMLYLLSFGVGTRRSIHERSYDSSPTYDGRKTSIPHHLLFTKNGINMSVNLQHTCPCRTVVRPSSPAILLTATDFNLY